LCISCLNLRAQAARTSLDFISIDIPTQFYCLANAFSLDDLVRFAERLRAFVLSSCATHVRKQNSSAGILLPVVSMPSLDIRPSESNQHHNPLVHCSKQLRACQKASQQNLKCNNLTSALMPS
jgi:hypothetical protein